MMILYMGVEYGTAYDGDSFSKLIADLENHIQSKTKNKNKIEKLIPFPDSTETERVMSEYISSSIMEGKDLEIFHDRLVQLAEKLEK